MNKMTEENLPFTLTQNTGFGTAVPADELLHPESFRTVKDDSATETQYFGFSIPEERIHATCQLWHHPNLHVVTGGLFVFQGMKKSTVHAELCDWRTYMSDAVLKNDLHEFRFDNGYGVKILEPMKRFHMTYSDPARKNSVDLVFEATLPIVMFGDGKHFEQTMAVRGELVLRGKRYDVDCFTVRDRSWGKPRPEDLMPLPPFSWLTGTYAPGFSFNCTMLDQQSGNPHPLAAPDDQPPNGGWIYRDGKLGRIVAARKRVKRGAMLEAIDMSLVLTDDHGRKFDMQGTHLASCPIQVWGNLWARVNLMQWKCDGHTGHGDAQEMFSNDALNQL